MQYSKSCYCYYQIDICNFAQRYPEIPKVMTTLRQNKSELLCCLCNMGE